MYTFLYLVIASIGILVYLNEIIADLNIKRDAKLSTVNITITFTLIALPDDFFFKFNTYMEMQYLINFI